MPVRRALAMAVALSICFATAAPAMQPPDDPLFSYQWNLRAIGLPSGWAASRGAGVIVAVLDTGVAFEDRGAFRRARDLAGARLAPGYDFVDDDAYPDDVAPRNGRRSHGTQVASIIAATAGNGIGGVGVAPEATIMPIRVLASDTSGTAADIAKGLRFAADRGADVANLSIAGDVDSPVLQEAVAYAARRGVLIVAAAGNDGRAGVGWPAAYPEAIAVGAVDRAGRLAAYSNHGAALDLVAPGGAGEGVDTGRGPRDGVLGEALIGGPARFCFCLTASTSAAAAEVSGVAALLIGARPGRSPAAIRRALFAGARDLGPPGRDTRFGVGVVQAPRVRPADRPATTASGDGWVWGAAAAAGCGALLLLRRRRLG